MCRKLNFARQLCVSGVLLVAGGWMSLALAIDPPPSTATKPPATSKPAADKPAADKPATDKPATDKTATEAAKPVADDVDEAKPPPPKPGSKSSGSPQRFEPSEQVRPDFDVSFPIDI